MKRDVGDVWVGEIGISVLSVEPYGMKLRVALRLAYYCSKISVLSVEPYGMKPVLGHPDPRLARKFQCSRSSRMG